MRTEPAAPAATATPPGDRETLRAAVVVGALGVVFGDLRTSPIYTIQTVFNPADCSLWGSTSTIFPRTAK